MIDMVNSDQIVPEFENVDVPEHESIVDEVPNDFTDIVENTSTLSWMFLFVHLKLLT